MNKEELSDEIWRPVEGYESLYEVSSLGRVKRTEGKYIGVNRFKEERILSQGLNPSGYHLVSLSNGKSKTFKVARLVAKAFCNGYFEGAQANHINEDKDDNRACNLEWVSAKQNSNHGTRNYRLAKLNSKLTVQYDKAGKFIAVYKSAHEASRITQIDNVHISECARGIRKTTGGFKWEYIDSQEKLNRIFGGTVEKAEV